jgi:hypothetical protein
MDNLADRISDLYASLKEFDATQHPTRSLAPVYNTLIDAAKDALPDDPIVQAMIQTGTQMHNCRDNAGAMRANLRQILVAMGEAPTAEPT